MQRLNMKLLICLTSLTSYLFASYDHAEVERFADVKYRFLEIQATVGSEHFDRSQKNVDLIQGQLQSLKQDVSNYRELVMEIDFLMEQIEALVSPVPEVVENEEAYNPNTDHSHLTQDELALEYATDLSVAAATGGARVSKDIKVKACSKDCTCPFCEFQKKRQAKRLLSPCSYCGSIHPKGKKCESFKAQMARDYGQKSRKMKKTPKGRLMLKLGLGKRP